jgi:membrane protein implicated in regulation of membrane protease activity
MEVHHWWFILALALGVGEMLTAGFYLLVLALGALAAGAVAWAGGSSSLQLLVAAVVSVVGWSLLWRRSRARAAAAANEDGRGLGLDVGERLHIEEWLDGRRTRVSYRGAQWTAELDEREPDSAAGAGTFVIERLDGSVLIVRPRAEAVPVRS